MICVKCKENFTVWVRLSLKYPLCIKCSDEMCMRIFGKTSEEYLKWRMNLLGY